MRAHDLLGTQFLQVPIPANLAGDATSIVAQLKLPFKCRIISIRHNTNVAFAGQATNYRTLNVMLKDSATVVANVSYNAAGVTSGPNVDQVLTLNNLNVKGSKPPAANVLAQGDCLLVQNVLVGTGQAIGAGILTVEVAPY